MAVKTISNQQAKFYQKMKGDFTVTNDRNNNN